MKYFINKLRIVIEIVIGSILKLLIVLFGFPKCESLGGAYDGKEVIISLTSYGRRISKAVPFTLYSLFRQSVMPTKIVLVLDEGAVITKRLQFFCKKGLSIIYDGRDLRSYKKLIPVLERYPDALVITADDDIYYRKDFAKGLLLEYSVSKGETICGYRAHKITFNQGVANNYRQWIDYDYIRKPFKEPLFLTGCGGVLYQKKLLHPDIFNIKLFKEKCPIADDVYFYFMAKLIGTKLSMATPQRFYIVPIDAFYQIIHRGSRLASYNCGQDLNDVQIKNLEKYYNVSISDFY